MILPLYRLSRKHYWIFTMKRNKLYEYTNHNLNIGFIYPLQPTKIFQQNIEIIFRSPHQMNNLINNLHFVLCGKSIA